MGGFSKAYAMTGWRVGYLAAPAAILEGIVKVHQYGIMSAPTTAQDAALEAILHAEADVERMRVEYDRRRRLVVDGLNAIGLRTFEPRGAFYAFPEVTSATGLSSEAFAERLLTEEHVAVIPGSAFGPSGEGHVRACYATSYEKLEEALVRIGRFVERQASGARRLDDADDCSRRAGPSSATRRSSGSRSTASSRPPRRCSAAARPTTTARPRTPTSARLPRPAGRPADDQPARRRARPRDRRRDRGDDARRDPLGPQELLLSRPAEGLPDQPVRPAPGVGRPADGRDVGGSRDDRDHPGAPRGGHGQAHPRDRRTTAARSASSTSTAPALRSWRSSPIPTSGPRSRLAATPRSCSCCSGRSAPPMRTWSAASCASRRTSRSGRAARSRSGRGSRSRT